MCVCVSAWALVCRFIHMHACLCCLSVCEGFLEKSWSWVNMLWNVNCLHDNSPVSSFRLSSSGCMPRQPNQVCHGISPLTDLSYLKNYQCTFLNQVPSGSKWAKSSVPLAVRPGLDEHTCFCVCLCRSNSEQSFESPLTGFWQAFKWRRCCVLHIVDSIAVCMSLHLLQCKGVSVVDELWYHMLQFMGSIIHRQNR